MNTINIGISNEYSTNVILRLGGNKTAPIIPGNGPDLIRPSIPGVTVEQIPTVLTSIPGTNCYVSDEVVTVGDMIEREVADPDFKLIVSAKEKQRQEAEYRRVEEKLPEVELENISFRIIKRDELIKYSILVDREVQYGSNTINDPRMGVVLGKNVCGTCNRSVLQCPTHLGRIELAEPMVNPLYRRDVIRMLQAFCNDCGALLLTEDQIKSLEKYTAGRHRLQLIADNVASKKGFTHTHTNGTETVCPTGLFFGELKKCSPNPKYILDKKRNLSKIEYKIGSVGDPKERTMAEIIDIFSKVTKSDAILAGLSDNMPIDFIMYDIVVIPPTTRGASIYESNIETDRMAAIYLDIISNNNKIKSLTLSESVKDSSRTKLYEKVQMLMMSSDPKSARGGNQVSVNKKLKGKTGIFRGNLMSARVDFTARSVITPGIDLEFGWVGIPKDWASILTIHERIFSANITYMNSLLRQKKLTHITKASGPYENLWMRITDENRDSIILEIGDEVDRHLRDGDVVTINRMPTLHKGGLICRKVKLTNNKTISIHLSDTTALNADFDGDEMNVKTMQSWLALAEIGNIMSGHLCIPNDQTNAPIVGLVMDNLIASYLITKFDPILNIYANPKLTEERVGIERANDDLWQDCLMLITAREDLPTLDERLFKYGVRNRTGRALFSSLLPAGFYYDHKDVKIIDGILIKGVVGSSHVGTKPNSIIQYLYNFSKPGNNDSEYGLKRASAFITDASLVLNRWLSSFGFSIGVGDCKNIPEVEAFIAKEIVRIKALVAQQGANLVTDEDREKYKQNNLITIGTALNTGKQMMDHYIPETNNVSISIASGTKGSTFNQAQISGMVGQVTIWGDKLPLQLTSGSRILPHFEPGDEDIEAHGYVTNNYFNGLEPTQFFMLSMGGREGLLDTALQISNIGKLRRQMLKNVEDLKIEHDGSVRVNNRIVLLSYGGDGFAPERLQRVNINKGDINVVESLFFSDIISKANEINSRYGY